MDMPVTGSVYAEYGFGERLTLGLDGFRDWSNEGWTTLAFLRRSFNVDGPNVWALGLAAGPARTWDGKMALVIRPELHWGRGTDWGWLSAESYVVHKSKADGLAYKLDLTAGWKMFEDGDLIFQVQSAKYSDTNPSVRLAPSYIRRFGEKWSLKTGLIVDVKGTDYIGASTALWFEF